MIVIQTGARSHVSNPSERRHSSLPWTRQWPNRFAELALLHVLEIKLLQKQDLHGKKALPMRRRFHHFEISSTMTG
jgi:hypothetical protein